MCAAVYTLAAFQIIGTCSWAGSGSGSGYSSGSKSRSKSAESRSNQGRNVFLIQCCSLRINPKSRSDASADFERDLGKKDSFNDSFISKLKGKNFTLNISKDSFISKSKEKTLL